MIVFPFALIICPVPHLDFIRGFCFAARPSLCCVYLCELPSISTVVLCILLYVL